MRWFSKCIQLVDAGKATGVPGTMRSVLHSNRAFAYLKLQKWEEAEEDSDKALGANPQNTKAKHRRAVARFELGKSELALEDVDAVLKEFADPRAQLGSD